MQFRIKAFQHGSGVRTIVADAADARSATAKIAAQGFVVLDVSTVGVFQRPTTTGSKRFPLLLFNQELVALLDSGLPMLEAFEALAEKEHNAFAREVIAGVVARLQEGVSLSAAFAAAPDVFPPLYVATIRAAERTSDLTHSLRRYIAYQQQLDMIRSRLVSAAAYPVILIAVGVLVVLFLLGYVVPRFAHIFEDMGGELPFMSRLLLSWGQFAEQYAVAVGVSGVVIAGAAIASLSRSTVRAWLVQQLWRAPWFGERLKVYQLARFYRTLGMLLRGGIPVVSALEMSQGLLSQALRANLVIATARIREGGLISEAMSGNGLTTPIAYRMLRVGEKSGGLGEMMERIAGFHDDEMARYGELFAKLIGPALMLLMGLLIGMIVVLMYLPIFQLAESIQ